MWGTTEAPSLVGIGGVGEVGVVRGVGSVRKSGRWWGIRCIGEVEKVGRVG